MTECNDFDWEATWEELEPYHIPLGHSFHHHHHQHPQKQHHELQEKMSRPGPKPSLENERLAVYEEILRHLVEKLPDPACAELLERLNRLHSRRQEYCCSICAKTYSDSKGLRRRVIGSSDDGHMKLANTPRALCCSRCGRGFPRREQVTKHENNCNSDFPAGNRKAWAEPEEESDRISYNDQFHRVLSNTTNDVSNLDRQTWAEEEDFDRIGYNTQLPRIMSNAAVPYATYFTKADVMDL